VFAQAAPIAAAQPLSRARGSRTEAVLIGLAALLGVLVTLHRNGVLHAVLASAGAESTYTSLETALGGPGFGTPDAVEALVKKTPQQK
jgi:hypothetical protein